MKLKILSLAAMAVAGLGASYALAAKGDKPNHDTKPACQHAHVHGTVASPQSLTVTVTKAGKHKPFAPNQVVTVVLGATGMVVDLNAEGCATDASTLTAKHAELHAHPTPRDPPAGKDDKHHGHDHGTTITTTTTTTGASGATGATGANP